MVSSTPNNANVSAVGFTGDMILTEVRRAINRTQEASNALPLHGEGENALSGIGYVRTF